jgi:hypothetical protein
LLAAPSIPRIHLPQYSPASLATGTDGSNPSPSSGECSANLTSSPRQKVFPLAEAGVVMNALLSRQYAGKIVLET